MVDYRDKRVLVVDNGLFVHFAMTLAETFGEVLYYSPWEYPFPKSNQTMIGQDMLPNVFRVNSIWEVENAIDIFVFTDVNFGPLQAYLVGKGKRVWGARNGELLECNREYGKQEFHELGIDIGPYEIITGLADLREYLKDNGDVYVKVSSTRGDCETFYVRDYKLIEPRLDELEWQLGAKKNVMRFVVEAAINDAIEIGFDGYTIDGNYPRKAMWAIEVKDKGAILEATTYNAMPWQIRDVQEKLAPVFRRYGYRGFFSSEVRATEAGGAFLVDPCCRMPSPPSEIYGAIVDNWADIVWEGAEGNVIEPHFTARYGAELLIESQWSARNWQAVDFPDSIAAFVKLRNCTRINGRYYIAPQPDLNECIGGVVAVADTMDAAVAKVQRYAEQIEGYGIHTSPGCLDQAVEEYRRLATMNRKAA